MDLFLGFYDDLIYGFTGLLRFFIFLIATFALGKVIVYVLIKILKILRFESLAEKVGINDFLNRGEIKLTPLDLINRILSWIVVIMACLLSLKFLGINAANELIDSMLNYIGNIMIAFVIMIIGIVLADFVKGIIKVSAGNANLVNGDLLAALGKGLVVLFSIAMALEQLKVSPNLINIFTFTIFGSLGLGFAIAIGLGAKDKVAELVNKIFEKHDTLK